MNTVRLTRLAGWTTAALASMVVAACTPEAPITPDVGLRTPANTISIGTDGGGSSTFLQLCKWGPLNVPVTFTISASGVGTLLGGTTQVITPTTVLDPAFAPYQAQGCVTLLNEATVGETTVTITETVPTGMTLDVITGDGQAVEFTESVATRTATIKVNNTQAPRVIFKNSGTPTQSGALFILIDEDGIDNDKRYWKEFGPFTPAGIKQFSTTGVNDDVPGLAQRMQLRFFKANVDSVIWLWTGQVGDEGWFAPKTIPASWDLGFGAGTGLRNFLGLPVRAGLGTGSNPEALLDKIPDVRPLRAEGLYQLIGKTLCALVWDSDISINYGPINGSLKGEKLGIVAFDVLDAGVVYLGGFSSSTLPRVKIKIRDADVVCAAPLTLFVAPIPRSSSEPMDVKPGDQSDNIGSKGYILPQV